MRLTAALLLSLSVAGPAHAFGWFRGPSTSYSWPAYPVYSYSYGAPAYCYPAATPRVLPLTPATAPAVPYAPTRPAPPSGETKEPPIGKKTLGETKEPPLGKASNTERRPPTIAESRAPVIAPVGASDHCKVGFWNLTGKDVELNVAGKTLRLRKDQATTVELERQFTWNIVGQPPAQERVAEDRAFHEIILRPE
ncbi:MAG: hypothetical protein U0793_07855 [Gemmataceae bacterium]